MNRKLTFLAALVSLWIAGMVYGADFHVSPQGDDANPGTLDKPFKTLKRARNAVRTLKAANQGKTPTGGVTVWLRGGRYELTEPFVLGPEDSGQFNAPVVFRAYAKEQPVLSGGRVIRGWKQIEGDLPGLPAAAKGKVWVASVPEAKDGKWQFRQLWADGKRLPRARWPNLVEKPQTGPATGERSLKLMATCTPSLSRARCGSLCSTGCSLPLKQPRIRPR